MKAKFLLLLIISTLLFFGCMGGGTETTNGIQGRVSLDNLVNASKDQQFIAAIYSLEYAPDSGIGVAETTLVDSNGRFCFTPLSDNVYNLFVWHLPSGLGAYVPMLSPDTVLQAITLSRTGTIAGTVPDTVNGARVLFADIAIKGSPFFCRALAQEPFAMSLVPEGAYRIRVLYNANDSIRNEPMLVTIVKTLPVFPSVNDTTIVDIR